jgi:hypothetical protein
VETDRVVLFLHLLSLFVLIVAITLAGLSYSRVRAAQSAADGMPWVTLAAQTAWLFPLCILGLFASGAYLTSDVWTWSTPWIDASIVGLALVTVQGPLVAGPATKELDRALREHDPGPLDDHVRRLVRAPALWFIVCGNPAIVLAVAWVMTVKPGTAGSIAAIVVGYAVGAAATVLLTRPQAEATASAEPR